MSELLPEHLGNSANDTLDRGSSTKLKHCLVTNILGWIQCFGIYMTVLARKQPMRIPNVIVYQTIIIKAQLEFEGDGWIGYDRRFKQRATAKGPSTKWACIDPTLWSLA